ncbi:MAG: TauD/TfdA family dioxygenase [Betaproteobacteria bacterium]|nr:TauD/TfdA family dioxygenase [Betaproteobacteria bacterium]
MSPDPFNLDDRNCHGAYERWRDEKLASLPARASELIVEVRDPRALSPTERTAIVARLKRANMAIYASPVFGEDKSIPMMLGRQFGLDRFDGNWLADEDKVTRITVNDDGTRKHYIPYTTQPIKWHTDGYYNDTAHAVRAMILHCVRPAVHGGENTLLDHEIAYLRMRDHNPDFVRAMMAPQAMTIPAREDDDGVARAAVSGPVFSCHPESGRLHMRYTARTRSIAWAGDATTRAAVAWLEGLLASELPGKIRARLEPGMGLLCANVLHDRTGFEDDAAAPRLLYRARYHDEINGEISRICVAQDRKHTCPAQ